jgi:hypothetical protein
MYCDHPCHTWGLIVPHVSISLHIMVQSSLLGSITPLVTVPAVGLHGVIDLFWETTPAEVADRCIFWCRFYQITHIYTNASFEKQLCHIKILHSLICALLSIWLVQLTPRSQKCTITSAFPNNHVYITISISFWIDWVWYYCIEIPNCIL